MLKENKRRVLAFLLAIITCVSTITQQDILVNANEKVFSESNLGDGTEAIECSENEETISISVDEEDGELVEVGNSSISEKKTESETIIAISDDRKKNVDFLSGEGEETSKVAEFFPNSLKDSIGLTSGQKDFSTVINEQVVNTISPQVEEETQGDIMWSIEGGKLILSGVGEMQEYTSKSDVPWYENRNDIIEIEIISGITSIGSYAFCDCINLMEVSIGETVSSIGKYAFYNCDSLKNVELPDTIEEIGYQAFAYCESLQEINIPLNWNSCPSADGSTINADYCGQIFYECKSLTEVTVPIGMTAIPGYGFNKCNYLETIHLPDTLTSIKNHTFYNCTNLKNISIPEGVTDIGKSAFCYCKSLVTMVVPKNVKTLNVYAFYSCSVLSIVKLPDTIEEIGYQVFAYCESLQEINIPLNWNSCPSANGSTINADYCGQIFYECKSLTEVTVPIGMTAIPSYGFNHCNYLETIHLPNTLTVINNHTFYNCTNLKNIILPDGITSIGKSAFYNCQSLQMLILPETVETFGEFVFAESAVTEIVIPEKVTIITNYCFYNCTSLSNITFAENVEKLGNEAFRYCTSLKEIDLKNVKELGEYTFSGSGLTSIELKDPMNQLGFRAFENCKSLDDITLNMSSYALTYNTGGYSTFTGCGSGVGNIKVTIGEKMDRISALFPRCTNLTSIKIPENVTQIGVFTFYGCTNLSNITFPENVEKLGNEAFRYCTSLKEIDLKNVKELGEYTFSGSGLTSIELKDPMNQLGFRAFENCKSLDDITLNMSSYALTYNTGGYSTFTGCGSGVGNIKVTIGEKMGRISALFPQCTNLTSIKIPENVTQIGVFTFYGCTNLSDIIFTENVKNIGDKAFYDCKSIDVLNINTNIELGSDVFTGASMNELKVGANVTLLSTAFYSKKLIGKFTVDAANSVYSSQEGVLFDRDKQTLLCYPNKNEEISYVVPTSVTKIDDYAFYQNPTLETIDFEVPEVMTTSTSYRGNITTIGTSAFQDCNSLKEVSLPASVAELNDYALADCEALEAVHFQGNAPEVSSTAFQNDIVAVGHKSGATGWDTLQQDLAGKGVVIVNEDKEYDRTVVMVLDHSWSMEGEPLSTMKEAAKSFCSNILNKVQKDTAICVVPFCGTSKAYGYFQEADLLESYIDSIECDNSTNIYGAMLAADRYLKMSNTKEKSIMLMTDGLPVMGESSYEGPYTSSDYPEYYTYANAVYNLVKGMSASYRIYTVGLLNLLSGVELTFAKRFLNDLQTVGYYEAEDISQLITAFEELAQNLNGDTYLNMDSEQCAFYFRDAITGEGIKNVRFLIGLETYYSDENGYVKIAVPKIAPTVNKIDFSREGYMDYSVSNLMLQQGKIYMYSLMAESDMPTAKACIMQYKDDSSTIDLLSKSLSISEDEEDEFTLQVLGAYKKDIKNYILYNDSAKISTSTTGMFDGLSGTDFPAGSSLYVRVVGEDGVEGERQKLNLKIQKSYTGEEITIASEKLELTAPDNLPIIGGASIEMDFTKLPVKICRTDEGKIQIAINFITKEWKDGESSKSGFFDKDTWNAVKKAVKEGNPLGEVDTKEVLKYVDETAAPSKLGTGKINFEVYGYIELEEDGTLVEGAISVNVEGSKKWENQMYAGGVPMVFTVEVKAGVEGNFVPVIKEIDDVTLQELCDKIGWEITIKPTFSLAAGVGVGYARLVNLTVNGKGTLDGELGEDYAVLSLKAEGFILKLQVLGYSVETDAAAKWDDVIYSKGKVPAENTMATFLANSTEENEKLMTLSNMLSFSNASEYEIAGREYLEKQSGWNTSGNGISVQTASGQALTTILQSSVYDDPQLQLIQSDDTTMIAFLTDDGTRSDINRTKLVYSIYDESNNSWSIPKAVEDDGTADFSPVLATDGESIYVAWMDMKSSALKEIASEDFAALGEISLAKFDGENFVNTKTITNDSSYDNMPAMLVKDGEAYLTWIKNTSNNMFCNDSSNSVYYYATNSAKTNCLASSVNTVIDLSIAELAEGIVVAYATDTDADLSTEGDQNIFVKNTVGGNLYSKSGIGRVGRFSSTKDTLLWYEDGTIKALIDTTNGATNYLGFTGHINSNYQIIETADSVYVLCLAHDNGNDTYTTNIESYIYVYNKETGTWGDKAGVSNLEMNIQSAKGFFTSSGTFNQVIATNKIVEANEDYSNEMSLVSTKTTFKTDYELTNVNVSGDIQKGETGYTVNATVEVKNRGQLPGSDYKIALVKNNVELSAVESLAGLNAGEIRKHDLQFAFEGEISQNEEYQIVLITEGEENTVNNSQAITLGYANLVLDYEYLKTGDIYSLAISVRNTGLFKTDAELILRQNGSDGEVLQTMKMNEISSGETRTLIITVDANEWLFEERTDTGCVYMEILCEQEELSKVDNADYCIINKPEEEDEKPIENPFTDVPTGEYYYDPVLWALENNITSGLTATTFAPEASCTRGQVVTFLWRAHGCPEPTSTSHNFTDLKENEYYYKAVLWAVENGITSGMTKTTFAPDATVTRGQFVTFLHRAEGKPTYTVSNPFTDLKTGEYYYDAVLWAVENGVTSGLKPTLFGPEEPCTRGQVVTFLYRAYNE